VTTSRGAELDGLKLLTSRCWLRAWCSSWAVRDESRNQDGGIGLGLWTTQAAHRT